MVTIDQRLIKIWKIYWNSNQWNLIKEFLFILWLLNFLMKKLPCKEKNLKKWNLFFFFQHENLNLFCFLFIYFLFLFWGLKQYPESGKTRKVRLPYKLKYSHTPSYMINWFHDITSFYTSNKHMENAVLAEVFCGVIAKVLDCVLKISKLKLRLYSYVHFQTNYPEERHEPPCPSSYGLNSISAVLQG